MRPITHVDPARGKVERSKIDRSGTRCRCGKRAYSSKKIAKAKAAERSTSAGEVIEAYHCYVGHCHHVGHPPEPYDYDAERARAAAS